MKGIRLKKKKTTKEETNAKNAVENHEGTQCHPVPAFEIRY